MLGLLDQEPFDLHISPFMTREKSDSNFRRTINDLSFPKGLSVSDGVLNNTYLGMDFQMHYPSVDSIIRTLNEIGPSAHIFKVDGGTSHSLHLIHHKSLMPLDPTSSPSLLPLLLLLGVWGPVTSHLNSILQ